MNKIFTLIILLSISLPFINAEEDEKKFKVEIHGFVGGNAFYDTRQSATARNGNIYLFPKPASLDNEGNDINAIGNFDVDVAYSRFNIGLSGPELLGAKTFAFIEGDFLGDKNTDHQDVQFRLRHAFIRLTWKRSSLLLGQYWHPLFITENYAKTVNLSCGTPYHPLNRQPMLRFGYLLGDNIESIAYIMTQNDFLDKGMSPSFENSYIPEMALQLKYKKKDLFAAITGGYKALRPELVDPNTGIISKETAKGHYLTGSFKKNLGPMSFKTEALYTAGMTNVVMLGGFAEKDNSSPEREYTAIKNFSFWADLEPIDKKISPGVMFGYTQNLGTMDRAVPLSGFTIGGDIANMYSIIPRIKYMASPKLWLGIEWMYVVAAYGSSYDEYAKPINLTSYTNNRITASMRFVF